MTEAAYLGITIKATGSLDGVTNWYVPSSDRLA
jgi:hypothetical protein